MPSKDVTLRLLIEAVDRASKTLGAVSNELRGVGKESDSVTQKSDKMGDKGAAAAEKLNRKLKETEERFHAASRAAGDLISAGMQLGAIGAGLLAATFFPVKEAANFERAMSAVVAVTDNAEESYKQLAQRAKDLGASTRFTAKEAAEGMKLLGMAGLDASEVIEAIGPALELAAAGNLALADSADIATNVMSGFQLGTEDLQHVMDVLANTASKSNTSVYELGEAMSYAAPLARAAGVSLDEAAATMGTLANNGIKASRAGTGVRAMLISLAAQTPQAEKAVRELGIELIKSADGSIDLTESMRKLGMSELDVSMATEIFRRTGAAAALAISSQVTEVDKLTKSNIAADGAAKKMATTMEENLIGALIRLGSAFSGLLTAIGEPVLKPLREITLKLADVVSGMKEWAEANPVITKTLLGMTAVLGSILTVLGALFITVGLSIKAFSSLGLAWLQLIRFGPKLKAMLIGLRADLTVTAAAAGLMSKAFLALQLAMTAFEVFKAVQGFIAMRKAMVLADKSIQSLTKSSAKLKEQFSDASDYMLPQDITGDSEEELQGVIREAARYRAYLAGVRGELYAKSKETFLGFATKEAKQASDELFNLSMRYKQVSGVISDASKRLDALRTARKGAAEVDTSAAVKKSADELAIDRKLQAERLVLEQDSVKKINALRALEIKEFKESAAAAKYTEEQKATAIYLINKKYNLQTTEFLRDQTQVRNQLRKQEADLAKLRNADVLKTLESQFDTGNISLDQYFAERRVILDAEYDAEIQLLRDKIAAAQAEDVPVLQLQIEEAEIKRGLATKELAQGHIEARQTIVDAERSYTDRMLQMQLQLLEPTQVEEAKALELEILQRYHAQVLVEMANQGINENLIIEQKYLQQEEMAKRVADIDKQNAISRAETHANAASRIGDTWASMYAATGEKVKAFFYLQRAAAIGETIMNTLAEVGKVGAQTGIFGIPMKAFVYAQGMARVAMISAQAIRGFAEGGLFKGKKGKDQNVVAVSDNEYIVNPKAVAHYGVQFFEALNRRMVDTSSSTLPNLRVSRPGNGFASGGSTTGAGVPVSGEAKSEITIMNITDPREIDNYLASAQGQGAILNVLSSRAETVRRILH